MIITSRRRRWLCRHRQTIETALLLGLIVGIVGAVMLFGLALDAVFAR